jgi:hypothetical protein
MAHRNKRNIPVSETGIVNVFFLNCRFINALLCHRRVVHFLLLRSAL